MLSGRLFSYDQKASVGFPKVPLARGVAWGNNNGCFGNQRT
jgi:hypothetical protein